MDIYLLSCTKTKEKRRCSAKQMYSKSALFKLMWDYAETAKAKKIYILSAKYGVLSPDDLIDPYDMTLKTMSSKEKKVWAYDAYVNLTHRKVKRGDNIIFLAGEDYSKYLDIAFKKNDYKTIHPLKGLGMGKRMEFMKKELNSQTNDFKK